MTALTPSTSADDNGPPRLLDAVTIKEDMASVRREKRASAIKSVTMHLPATVIQHLGAAAEVRQRD